MIKELDTANAQAQAYTEEYRIAEIGLDHFRKRIEKLVEKNDFLRDIISQKNETIERWIANFDAMEKALEHEKKTNSIALARVERAMLKEKGFKIMDKLGLGEDSVFADFQREWCTLEVDGEFGPKTWAALKEAIPLRDKYSPIITGLGFQSVKSFNNYFGITSSIVNPKTVQKVEELLTEKKRLGAKMIKALNNSL